MRHAKRQQLTQHAAKERAKDTKRSWALIRGLAAFCFAGMLAIAGYLLLTLPATPLPREWNPTLPLVISDPVTPLTQWNLNRTSESFERCVSALAGYATVQVRDPLQETEQCFFADRVSLGRVGASALQPVETRCSIALRMAMWERHTVQPAAALFLGTQVRSIAHIGSYNCRPIRSSGGPSTRMSTHATADAIDIAGFDMTDGTRIRLLDDWAPAGPRAEFLRAVRDGACDWFSLTLSPDYNRLHADHFHLQSRGWGLCR